MEQNDVKKHIEERVIDVLKDIFDPEIPVNIYELGLIYKVEVSDEQYVYILMTLTSPNCPVAESLPADVKNRVAMIKEVQEVEVEITFEPPWTKDMLSEEAMLDLGMI